MKYLIAGLGNIGPEYSKTRHNIGFMTLDAFAGASSVAFELSRFANTATAKVKGRSLLLIKPTTFMNLSGKAVRYWLGKENIPLSNLLVIMDDIALPFGTIRIRPGGGNAGHNGLKSIDELLETDQYARLRFGIGNNFPKGMQSDYVLSPFGTEEQKLLEERLEKTKEIIKSFVTQGLATTMNQFNNK